MYKSLLIIVLLLSFFSIDCRANNVIPLTPPVTKLRENIFNYKSRPTDYEAVLPVRELINYLPHTISWDHSAKTATLLCKDLELTFTNNSNRILINNTPYQLSLIPYIKADILYVPVNDTYSCIASYLVKTEKDKSIYSDLSQIGMYGTFEGNHMFPDLFFYKDIETESLITIPVMLDLEMLNSMFDVKYTTELWGERVFYYFTSDLGISGCFVEEYEDESLARIRKQSLYSITITSPLFFTDRLIRIGATKDEVMRRYGYPTEGFNSNVWCTIDNAEGVGIKFYFNEEILTKFSYGR